MNSYVDCDQDTRLIDIATRNIVCLTPSDSVGEAASIMTAKCISSIVVIDERGHPAGIVTERNMLHALQVGLSPEIALLQVMSAPVITVPETIGCLDAYQLCLHVGIRHLVIVDNNNRLLGVISETDFRLHLNLTALAGRCKIATIARRSMIALPPSACLRQALDMMLDQNKSCTVVVEEKKPIGIITERDVVHFYSGDKNDTDITLGQIMISPVLTLPFDAPTSQAAKLMLARKVRHLVIVDDKGGLAGLVSEHELTMAMDSNMAEERGGVQDQFLHTLIKTLPDLVWLKDLNGVYLACNARFEHFFGAPEKEIVGKTDYDFVDKELADFFREHDCKAMGKNGLSVNEEWVTFANDGHRELLETIKSPMYGSQGKLIGVLGIARDVTGRKQAELALRQALEFSEGVINAIPDLLLELDREGRYLNIWAHDPHLLAAQKTMLLGRTVNEMLTPEAARIVMSAIQEADNKGESRGQVIRLNQPQGESWFELSTVAKPTTDDSTRHFLMLSRDVTNRMRTEAALRASEEKLRGLYELSPMGIALTDMQGHYIEFNDAFQTICGYTHEELNQLDYWALTPKEYADKEAEQLASLNSKGSYGPYLKEYIRKDGSRIPLLLNGVLIHDHSGNPFIWSIIEDITERKRAEDALRNREEIFSAIVNQAADSILLIDPETMRFVEFNWMAHESLGYTREEFQQLTLADVQAQYNPQQVHRILDDATSSQHPLMIETMHRRKDGSLRHTQVSSRAITIQDKRYFSSIWSDITQRKEAEMKLQQSEAHFRFVTESAQALTWMAGTDKLCTWFNKVWLDFTGRTMEQEVGNGWAEGVHPDDMPRCLEIYISHFDRREPFSMEYRLRHYDGEYRWILDNGAPRFGAQGVFEGYIGSCFDITERKKSEESLRINASVFDTSQEAILITDANNVVTDVNSAFTRITGYSRSDVLGRNPKILSSGRHDKVFYDAMWQTLKQEKSWRGEIRNRRKSGEVYTELLSISVVTDPDGRVLRYVGVFSDISQLKEHEEALIRAAHYDALTGIPNRTLLADRMKQAIAQSSREQDMMAVCYLDLDGFKPINDKLGHKAGDQVLIEVAKRLGHTIRGGDTLARLGGDEFVMLLLGLKNREECVVTLKRILEAVALPILIKEQTQSVSASIGVSFYPLDEDPDILLRHADQAMYMAKQSGKNRFYTYDSELD